MVLRTQKIKKGDLVKLTTQGKSIIGNYWLDKLIDKETPFTVIGTMNGGCVIKVDMREANSYRYKIKQRRIHTSGLILIKKEIEEIKQKLNWKEVPHVTESADPETFSSQRN